MNFQTFFERGREGKNTGLDTGIPALTKAINGIQKKNIYGIAAAPKVGKTTLADYCFVLAAYLDALAKGIIDDIEWIYFSFEIDRISKEFKFVSFFFSHDYQIHNFKHKNKLYKMSATYLMGKEIDEDGEPIRVTDEHAELVKKIYLERIIPLFGRYDANGKRTQKGKIDFIQEKDNPTGLRNFLMRVAKENGEFLYETYYTEEDGKKISKQRINGYKPKDEKKMFIIVTDHIRKLKPERGYSKKENIDKYLEYQVELRDWCHFTFVDICHTNRNMASVERMKFAGEFLYPTGDDLKDTGNLSEDANVLMTMFDANDEKYGLEKHFGIELEHYPNYRSIHIVESRETECPMHIQVNMLGGINYFEGIHK